jgi:hypothetical protein
MKIFAPAFVALMILVSVDQLYFYGRYTDPVFGTLRYLCSMAGIDFKASDLGTPEMRVRPV